MYLAEALAERARLRRSAKELAERIADNRETRAGKPPPEDPNALMSELERVELDIVELDIEIAATNVETRLAGGEHTISTALAARDKLRRLASHYRSAASSAGRRGRYVVYRESEVEMQLNVDPADLYAKADEAEQNARELDRMIQRANWTTEV